MSKLAELLRDLGHAIKAKRWAQAVALGLAIGAAAVTGYCVGGDPADNAPENSAPADSQDLAE